MMFFMPMLLRVAPWIAGLAMIIGTGAFIHHEGAVSATEKTTATYEAKISTMRAAAQQLHDKEVELAHAVEQQKGLQIQAIEQKRLEDIEHEKQLADKTIADIRSGALQLRKRLAAPVRPVGLPGAAASPTRCDGADAAGLQPADAEFLVREASRADEIVIQLSACQAVILADRAASK